MRRYLMRLVAWMGVCIIAAVAINVVVDPYDVFDSPALAGVNVVKSRAGQRSMLSKRYRIYSLRPHGLILGNSRAEIGFDPQHPAWPPEARPVMNAAIPGGGLDAARQLLVDAAVAGAPKVVLIGVDFVDFRLARSQAADGDTQHEVRSLDWPTRLRDYASITLSLDALYDSALTVLAQREKRPRSITGQGFNPMLDYVDVAAREGYGALFAQRNGENARNYVRGSKDVVVPGSGTSPAFEALRELVRASRSMGATVHVVIYPYHAHILELFDLSGLWSAFELWKRTLAELVEQELARDAAGPQVALWDFSGFNPFTSEPVPDPGNRSATVQWYWEAGHFKKELGDVVLARVLGGARRPQAASGSFGVPITGANIDAHLVSIRVARQAYREAHPREVAALRRLVDRTRESLPDS